MKLNDTQLDNLMDLLDETKRLESLTARELVYEVLGRPSADDPHVVELMNRVLPGWTNEFTEAELERKE